MQNYNVHTYVISMEFSAVNRRRPSRETPLGPGAKKDGCLRRLTYFRLSLVPPKIRELKHARFYDADGNRKRTFCLLGAYCLIDFYATHF